MDGAPRYEAEDKSVLLPYYKRFFVDPILPLIPARVDPNWITHVGHACCLAGAVLLTALRPSRGVVVLVSMVLLQAYLWCDNADGPHARRTGRTTTVGEYLDHGLDLLNTSYIGVMASLALGASAATTLAITSLVAGAAAVTCWEQAETGVFRLGMFNQIESVTLVSTLLTISAFCGTGFWGHTLAGSITFCDVIAVWCCGTILFGVVRSMLRVRAAGKPVAAAASLLGFFGVVAAAMGPGGLSPTFSVALCLAASVAFGVHVLAVRLRSDRPRFTLWLLFAIGAVGGVVACGALRARFSASAGRAATGLVCALFLALAVRDAGDMVGRLVRARTSQ